MQEPITAVVPLKALGQAKQRLAPALSPEARRELAAWMFGRVAAACQTAPSIGRVLAVTGDREAAAVAGAHGVESLLEPRAGLAHALAAADAAIGRAGAALVVAADVPLVGPDDLEAVCAAGAVGPVVVVAPTHDGGTGALLRRPATVITPAYGPGSAARHLARARAAGAAARTVRRRGLALDVDDAAGLRRAHAAAPGLVPARLGRAG